jgi:cell wall-associated NlpC family hydrolase
MMPSWVAEYVGRPYDPVAFNCWRLVVDVYREHFGIDLEPHATLSVADRAAVWLAADEERAAVWKAVEAAQTRLGDVILLRPMGHMHVGLIVEPGRSGRFLHVIDGRTASLERVQLWLPRLVGIYRHAALEREAA